MPDILADRHADRQTLDRHRLRQLACREIALFIKNIVIGQFDLVPAVDDRPILGQNNAVVELAVSAPDCWQQHGDVEALGFACQGPRSFHRFSHELALEQQILWEIAGQIEFGEHQDVGARRLGLCQRPACSGEVFGNCTDFGVQLSESNAERIGHEILCPAVMRSAPDL